jgi:hypothetical protein
MNDCNVMTKIPFIFMYIFHHFVLLKIIFLDMLNIFSLKKNRPADGTSNDTGTTRTSAALLRVTRGY